MPLCIVRTAYSDAHAYLHLYLLRSRPALAAHPLGQSLTTNIMAAHVPLMGPGPTCTALQANRRCAPSARSVPFRQCRDHVCSASNRDGVPDACVDRRQLLLSLAASIAVQGLAMSPAAFADEAGQFRVTHSDDEWRQLLTSAQYSVLRKAGTELPFSSPLNKEYREGTFQCAGCGSDVFTSAAKFKSGTGWPSFFEAKAGAVNETLDKSIPFLPRTEITCKTCGGHLGHVFNDGPQPTGLRYCMNGVALRFTPASDSSTT